MLCGVWCVLAMGDDVDAQELQKRLDVLRKTCAELDRIETAAQIARRNELRDAITAPPLCLNIPEPVLSIVVSYIPIELMERLARVITSLSDSDAPHPPRISLRSLFDPARFTPSQPPPKPSPPATGTGSDSGSGGYDLSALAGAMAALATGGGTATAPTTATTTTAADVHPPLAVPINTVASVSLDTRCHFDIRLVRFSDLQVSQNLVREAMSQPVRSIGHSHFQSWAANFRTQSRQYAGQVLECIQTIADRWDLSLPNTSRHQMLRLALLLYDVFTCPDYTVDGLWINGSGGSSGGGDDKHSTATSTSTAYRDHLTTMYERRLTLAAKPKTRWLRPDRDDPDPDTGTDDADKDFMIDSDSLHPAISLIDGRDCQAVSNDWIPVQPRTATDPSNRKQELANRFLVDFGSAADRLWCLGPQREWHRNNYAIAIVFQAISYNRLYRYCYGEGDATGRSGDGSGDGSGSGGDDRFNEYGDELNDCAALILHIDAEGLDVPY